MVLVDCYEEKCAPREILVSCTGPASLRHPFPQWGLMARCNRIVLVGYGESSLEKSSSCGVSEPSG